MKTYIYINDLRIRAHHGVLQQERKVGADFLITLRIKCDMSRSMLSDHVVDTINYAALCQLVRREMAISSRLLEHVAGRIARAVFHEFPQVESLDLWLTKVNPPMGADCSGAGVELHLINDKTN